MLLCIIKCCSILQKPISLARCRIFLFMSNYEKYLFFILYRSKRKNEFIFYCQQIYCVNARNKKIGSYWLECNSWHRYFDGARYIGGQFGAHDVQECIEYVYNLRITSIYISVFPGECRRKYGDFTLFWCDIMISLETRCIRSARTHKCARMAGSVHIRVPWGISECEYLYPNAIFSRG